MITATTPLDEIRRIGLEALLERLGPVGMVRFLQQFETGCGDYTAEREGWLTEMDLDTLVSQIRQRPVKESDEADDVSHTTDL